MLRVAVRRWWLSGFLASFGDGLRFAAFPLLAATITGSATAIAAVVALQGVPWLLVGPVVGLLVDWHGPRAVLVWVQSLQALAVGGLVVAVVAHADDLAVIGLCAFLTGVAAALRGTAQQTGTPRLVSEDADLDRVNGRLEAGSLIGYELLGPASAGVLFGVAAVLPFALDGGAIGIAVLLVLTLPGLGPTSVPKTRGHARAELGAGLRWVLSSPTNRTLIVASGVVLVADTAWFAVLVLYVTRALHHSAGDYGALLAIGAIGGIAAAAAADALIKRVGVQWLLALAVLVMAVTQLVLGLTAELWLAAIMLALSSGAFAIFNVVAVGIRQRTVPDALLGRVTSVYFAVAGGAEALGALLGGVIASDAGIRAPMLLGVVPLLGVAGALLVTQRRAGAS